MPQTSHIFQNMNYWLYTPEVETKSLIVFLHGSGERGTDAQLVKQWGLPLWIDNKPDFPFYVVSPQCPLDIRWFDHEEPVMALIESIITEYQLDRARIYLTGLSMGGQGTWSLAAAHPDYFAAIAPVCGRIPPGKGWPAKVCALKDTPTWAWHGKKDARVSYTYSKRLTKLLEKCGGDVRLTIDPEGDHFFWDTAYHDPALYQWFASHNRS